jgi:hypothetical protein
MKMNIYGVPIFTKKEQALLHEILLTPACKVCRAKSGHRCVGGQWDGKNMVYTNRKDRWPLGRVHMGRLPDGFDSLKAVKEAKKKLRSK